MNLTKIQAWVKAHVHVLLPVAGSLYALAVQQGWLSANSKLVTVVVSILATLGIHLSTKV